MEKTRLYFFAVELASKGHREKLNMTDKAAELNEGIDRFNKRCSGVRYLYLLSLKESRLEFVLRLDGVKTKNIDVKEIGIFTSIMCKDFGWYSYLEHHSSGLFQAIEIKKLDAAGCRELVNKTSKEANIPHDRALAEKLFENIRDESIFSEYSLSFSPDDALVRTKSLDEAAAKLESLCGLENFKNEMRSIIKFSEYSKQFNSARNISEPVIFPFHYVFTGERSIDHVYPSKIAAEIFFHLGLVKSRNFARLDIPQSIDWCSGINIDEHIDISDTGTVLVEKIFETDSDFNNDLLIDKLVGKMKQLKGRTLFIISVFEKDMKNPLYKKLINELEGRVNYRKIDMNLYNRVEVSGMAKNIASLKGFEIEDPALELLSAAFNTNKEKNMVDARVYVGKVIETAIFQKTINIVGPNSLTENSILLKSDIEPLVKENKPQQISPGHEQELLKLIGLEEVKKKVIQFTNFVEVANYKKNNGLKATLPCLHMEFAGNPGTGKTSVARIMAGIFKNLGVLSKGHLVEVTRNDLIAEYIGQTAPKVRKVIEEAKGGVLFIDEAYSLYGGSENDFGYEALAELVKAMEDHRDNLSVILAGYPREMEKLISMNPGLRDRIGFKIDFPDYSSVELVEIFTKMCNDSGYVISTQAKEEMEKTICLLCKNRSESFGNARLVRKLFERLEIVQSSRVCSSVSFDRESVLSIEGKDISELLSDKEVAGLIKGSTAVKKVGFVA